MEKKWEMNQTQKDFVADLKSMGGAATLLDLKLAGKDYKTGSVNTLVKKGIVSLDADKKDYEMEVVFNGVVVGKVTKSYSVYRLVSND